MEERINKLESQISFQDDTIAKLNEVVITQQKQIDEIEKELKLIKNQAMSFGIVKDIEDEEPPPHY